MSSSNDKDLTNDKIDPIIVTKGDNKINTIEALGDMQHALSRMIGSISHLKEYVDEKMIDSIDKNVIKKQIDLISDGTSFINDKVNYVTDQQGFTTLSNCAESRKRVASNLNYKVRKKLKFKCQQNYLLLDDNVLSSILYPNFFVWNLSNNPIN